MSSKVTILLLMTLLSQNSLNEIAQPFANQGIEHHEGRSWGAIRGEVYYYIKSSFDSLEISQTALSLELSLVESGGRVQASIGRGCKETTKAVGIVVKLEGVKAIVSTSRVNNNFCLVPHITINKIDINVTSSETPYPVDQIIDAVIDEFGSGPAKKRIKKELEQQQLIPLFLGRSNGIWYTLVKRDYYEKESFVITVDACIDAPLPSLAIFN